MGIRESPSTQYRRDKVAPRPPAQKISDIKIIKIRKGCQYVSYSYYSKTLSWAAENLRLGHMPEGWALPNKIKLLFKPAPAPHFFGRKQKTTENS